jgi:hypothetical protein
MEPTTPEGMVMVGKFVAMCTNFSEIKNMVRNYTLGILEDL